MYIEIFAKYSTRQEREGGGGTGPPCSPLKSATEQRGKVFAVTDVNNNGVFVVAFHETIMSVGPSAVKIRCQV